MEKKSRETAGGASPQPSKTKQKRVKVSEGQLVAVPLVDGTYGLVHVARCKLSIVGAHFAHRSSTPEGLREGLNQAIKQGPIAILKVTSDEIRVGDWPVIGQQNPMYPESMLDTKGSSYTAGMSRYLLSAYHGLRPWDEMYDPRCYEKVLLPGVPVPPTVRYKRDFEKAAETAAEPASAGSAEPPITEGPAQIHIEIKYPGDALPSLDLVRRRTALEEALQKAGAGEVTDAGGGGGVMDIWLQTEDVARSMPLVEAAMRASDFGSEARIETVALDDTMDEDEE